MLAVLFADIEDAADRSVSYLTGNADFVMEAGKGGGIEGCGEGEKLQRHDLAEFEIFGFVNFAHAALAEEIEYAVAAGMDHGSGDEAALNGCLGWSRRGRRGACHIASGIGEHENPHYRTSGAGGGNDSAEGDLRLFGLLEEVEEGLGGAVEAFFAGVDDA